MCIWEGFHDQAAIKDIHVHVYMYVNIQYRCAQLSVTLKLPSLKKTYMYKIFDIYNPY